MQNLNIKEETKKILKKLPNNAVWEDLMYEIYVREAIEEGLADSRAGRVVDVRKVRSKFGLPSTD